jgi:hypothetical protein
MLTAAARLVSHEEPESAHIVTGHDGSNLALDSHAGGIAFVSGQIQYEPGEVATPLRTANPLREDDREHLTLPVRFGRRRTDQVGHLRFSNGWLHFRGTVDLSVSWSEIARVDHAGEDLVVSLQGTQRTLRFSCQSVDDAQRACVTAAHLTALAQSEPLQPA